MKYIVTISIMFVLVTAPLYAQDISTAPVVAQRSSAEDASDRVHEIRNALFELNEKCETLYNKYEELLTDIDALKEKNTMQDKVMFNQSTNDRKAAQRKRLESSLELIRTELAQIREDISLLKRDTALRNVPTQKDWRHSRWLSLSSMGIALLALLVAL